MCRCHFTALRPTRRELQASAEGFTEGHIAAQFTERRCSATIRAIPSTLEWIDTAPHISLHLPLAATTYNLSVTRHLTANVLVSQGQNIADAIRQIGVDEVTYYRWRQESTVGLKADQVKRLKQLEQRKYVVCAGQSPT